jgi:hypothetical protein
MLPGKWRVAYQKTLAFASSGARRAVEQIPLPLAQDLWS